jgi:hypothetical protein
MRRSLTHLAFALILLSGSLLAQSGPGYTGIQGYYDYQTSYRTPQYVRCSPGGDTIHTIMMVAYDSLNTSTSRRSMYSISTNGGQYWYPGFGSAVPDRRSGFPSFDLAKGPYDGAALLVNHSTVAGTLQSALFVDYPVGYAAFSEIPIPLAFGGTDEPIFGDVVGAADGSVIVLGSRAAAGSLHATRTVDFVSWSPWTELTSDFTNDGFVADADYSGRVGIVIASPSNPVEYIESTNNGISWILPPRQLLPAAIPLGSDTFAVTQGLDMVLTPGGPLVAFGTTKLVNGTPTQRYSGIGFYSDATGFMLAVAHDDVWLAVDTLKKRQVNQNPIGYPAIGLSDYHILIAFQVFRAETSSAGFNYADIYLNYSSYVNPSWGHYPINHTQTASLDERYPSIAKKNSGTMYTVVYQEDPQPGSAVFGGDNSPLALVKQRCDHQWYIIESASEDPQPTQLALHQNFPNPFNPTTTIGFELSERAMTTLVISDILGRTVATLINDVREPGSYNATWNATGLASGMYFATLTSGQFRASRKLLLLR